MKETGFHIDGRDLPFSKLPEVEMSRLNEFALGGMARRAIRKALYSDFTNAGAGNEVLGLIFEHGSNAILPIGPLAYYPLSWVFRTARDFLEAAHEKAGAPALFRELMAKRRQYGKPKSVKPSKSIGSDKPEFYSLPGIALFSIPKQRDVDLIEAATDEFIKKLSSNERMTDDRLRSGILLLLARAGVPARNLLCHRQYYKINSFTQTTGTLHFVAVMPQADVGLGLLPIDLGDLSELIKVVLTRLKESKRKGLFDGREMSVKEVGGFITRMLGSKNIPLQEYGNYELNLAWIRVSNFNALWKMGGMLTAGLASSLFLPANYYDIGDLLNAENDVWQPLKSFDGQAWENPYIPNSEELADNLSVPKMRELLLTGTIDSSGEAGRPRRRDEIFKSLNSASSPEEFATFFDRYDCWPTRGKIITFLQSTYETPYDEAKKKAYQIFRVLKLGGRLHAGKPLRLIPTHAFLGFLEQLVTAVESPKNNSKKEVPQELTLKRLSWIWGGAALAMRIGETLVTDYSHYSSTGNFDMLHVQGTKSKRAKRFFPLHVARRGPYGDFVVSRYLEALNRCGPAGASLKGSKEAASQRASSYLADIMDATFRNVRGIPKDAFSGHSQIDGSFTHHSLRHAGAVRMLQGVLDEYFVSGDLWAGVSELAFSMGQSLHIHLCSYVGTAALLLKFPGKP